MRAMKIVQLLWGTHMTILVVIFPYNTGKKAERNLHKFYWIRHNLWMTNYQY
jgi:hypothetical protein